MTTTPFIRSNCIQYCHACQVKFANRQKKIVIIVRKIMAFVARLRQNPHTKANSKTFNFFSSYDNIKSSLAVFIFDKTV